MQQMLHLGLEETVRNSFYLTKYKENSITPYNVLRQYTEADNILSLPECSVRMCLHV